MKLSEHFTLQEFISSETADRLGIDNTPPAAVVDNLKRLAEGLESIRNILNGPILVSSGYRCERLNKAVGGASNSDHKKGIAADFICPSFGDVKAICKAIEKSGIEVDQCINEYDKWVHISFSDRNRNQHFKIG